MLALLPHITLYHECKCQRGQEGKSRLVLWQKQSNSWVPRKASGAPGVSRSHSKSCWLVYFQLPRSKPITSQVKLEYEKPDLCHHELDNIPKTFMKRLKSSGELGEYSSFWCHVVSISALGSPAQRGEPVSSRCPVWCSPAAVGKGCRAQSSPVALNTAWKVERPGFTFHMVISRKWLLVRSSKMKSFYNSTLGLRSSFYTLPKITYCSRLSTGQIWASGFLPLSQITQEVARMWNSSSLLSKFVFIVF